MISAASLRNMIPPAGGWPSARQQCRRAATFAKQSGQSYTAPIGRHWFTVQDGAFIQPCTAGSAYCRMVSIMFLNGCREIQDKTSRRMRLNAAIRWRKDAAFTGWRLP
jgi:hypothetical protein